MTMRRIGRRAIVRRSRGPDASNEPKRSNESEPVMNALITHNTDAVEGAAGDGAPRQAPPAFVPARPLVARRRPWVDSRVEMTRVFRTRSRGLVTEFAAPG
jgi:hypothetical protein